MEAGRSMRRCGIVHLEPQCEVSFSLQSVLLGGSGVDTHLRWLALAPHLDAPLELDASAVLLLGRFDAQRWSAPPADADADVLQTLVEGGLVLIRDRAHPLRTRDEQLRGMHWWGPAAIAHWMGRWQGQDSAAALESACMQTAAGLRGNLGPPPPAVARRDGVTTLLPHPEEDAFDALLQSRATCRNFDNAHALPLQELARLLKRVFAATGRYDLQADSIFFKKNVPSAGGLHPTEAYLLVQNVAGLATGIHHYDPASHALTRLPGDDTRLREVALSALAGQHWFADAHVLVVLAPRYPRTYWKYRNHAKAYRAVTLDVGHLSQQLLLCATQQKLGAFVTAAINEHEIERLLGLDPMAEGPMAICGVGWRAAQMTTTEFDPGQRVWEKTPGADAG